MNEKRSTGIASVLGKIAEAIRRLDDAEVDSLLSGDFSIDLIVGSRKDRAARNAKGSNGSSQDELVAVAQKLGTLEERDQGEALLKEKVPSKDMLIQLARHLDLPIQKRETVDRLKEKIIEATIGYRLRSRAIRGTEGAIYDSKTEDNYVAATQSETTK